jgi:hypothetical protein
MSAFQRIAPNFRRHFLMLRLKVITREDKTMPARTVRDTDLMKEVGDVDVAERKGICKKV